MLNFKWVFQAGASFEILLLRFLRIVAKNSVDDVRENASYGTGARANRNTYTYTECMETKSWRNAAAFNTFVVDSIFCWISCCVSLSTCVFFLITIQINNNVYLQMQIISTISAQNNCILINSFDFHLTKNISYCLHTSGKQHFFLKKKYSNVYKLFYKQNNFSWQKTMHCFTY